MEHQIELIAEQLRNAVTLIRADIKRLEVEILHQKEFNNHSVRALEEEVQDHETRLRSATEGVTQFKVWSGLASGSSSLMAMAALVKSFFGG